jgi:hypothetical protein
MAKPLGNRDVVRRDYITGEIQASEANRIAAGRVASQTGKVSANVSQGHPSSYLQGALRAKRTMVHCVHEVALTNQQKNNFCPQFSVAGIAVF